MGYDSEDLEKKALKAIKAHSLIFVNEVVSYLPCSSATFYNLGLEKLETIKEALDANKINQKVGLRKKWRDSENPALNIALYRLCSTEEEHEKLNNSKSNQQSNQIDTAIFKIITKDADSD